MKDDTTLLDIYEAAGATVNEERTSISFQAHQLQPFEIILKVIPTQVEMDGEGGEKITFGILLDSEVRFGKPELLGTPMWTVYHEASLSLPVSQVNIKKE